MDYSTIKITSKKVIRNTMDISTKEITSKKVGGSKVDFSIIEITSKKVCGNNVDFSTIEITLKKVRGNDEDFLISEITVRKYVEMTWIFWSAKLQWKSTWKWRGNLSKFGPPRIDVILALNRLRFDVGCTLGIFIFDVFCLSSNDTPFIEITYRHA